MSCDLDVDTDMLRRASELLRAAAVSIAVPPGAGDPLDAGEHAAGGSAAGRQAWHALATRVQQADQAAGLLVGYATRLAGMLDHAAALFDQAEALCRMGG